jgi:hypothetical protein
MRSRFAFLWLLLTAVIAGIAAYIAYGVGVATHLTTTTAADGVAYYHPFFPFFGFGFFIPILLIALLFLALRPRRWGGWGGYGGYVMKGGSPHGVPPHLEQRLQDWHKSAHGEAGPSTPPETPSGGDRTVA